MEELVYGLINDLATYPGMFVLVLDDYHAIHEPVLHQALGLLLDSLPQNMRMVLLTREDPLLTLSRLRARGQLVELRSDDLRFTPQEAASFLNVVMGLSLSPADVAALEDRTEGWIVGLQMAALSMQGREDASNFIASFSGSNRFILDYLVEEVLSRQPKDIQEFLLQTSLLERFCAGLCDAILEKTRGNGEKILDFLERANLFVVPLDNERHWYRYHHLFADLLRTRLQAARPELMPAIHSRASRWFELNGGIKEAVDHALAARDFERAAELIERHHVSRWAFTDAEFIRLVVELPLDVIEPRPALCLNRAWIQLISGQINVLPLIEMAERRLLPSGADPESLSSEQRGMLAFASTMRAYIADFGDQAPDLTTLGPEAVQFVPESNVGMRNSVAVVLGTLYYMESRFPEASRFFLEAIDLDKTAGTTNAVPISTSRLARLRIVEGRLRQAARLCQDNDQYIRQRGSWRFYVGGNLNVVLGDVLYEWNDLEGAEACTREGMRLNEPWQVPQANCMGYIGLARLFLARQDLEGAAGCLQKVDQLLERARIHRDLANDIEACRVRLWLATGEWSALERWQSENGLERYPTMDFRHELAHINLARIWLAQGGASEAARLLARLAQAAEAGGRSGRLIQILILQAVALASVPGTASEHGCQSLERALRLAEPEGYVRTFLDAGSALVPLLALCRPAAPEYARRLLEAFQATGTSASQAAVPPGRPSPSSRTPFERGYEPLSERELEVFHLVATGLSNQQIADRLIISIRTVKKHIENIYGKLGVSSRTQAIAKAHELNLL